MEKWKYLPQKILMVALYKMKKCPEKQECQIIGLYEILYTHSVNTRKLWKSNSVK